MVDRINVSFPARFTQQKLNDALTPFAVVLQMEVTAQLLLETTNHAAKMWINNTDHFSNSLCCSAAPSTGVAPVTLKETNKQEEDEAHLEEDF